MRKQEERNQLVLDNLGLAYKEASKWFGKSMLSPEDLKQIAVLGLLRAAETYDPTRARFSTYASDWLNQYLQRAVGKSARLNTSNRTWGWLAKIKRAEDELGSNVTPEQLAAETGLTVKQVKFAQGFEDLKNMASYEELLDAGYEAGADDDLGDFLERERIRAAVDELPHDQKAVIKLFYNLGDDDGERTHEEIAVKLGKDVQATRTLLAAAKERLKELLG